MLLNCYWTQGPAICDSRSMKAAFVCASALLVAGCSQGPEGSPLPSAADVARIEARLANHACVGDLARWERNYRHASDRNFLWPQSDHADVDRIQFHYRRTGTVAIAATRNIIPANESGDWPDSSPIQTLDGTFTISSGRLSVEKCKPLAD